jgi:hypothetical protein
LPHNTAKPNKGFGVARQTLIECGNFNGGKKDKFGCVQKITSFDTFGGIDATKYLCERLPDFNGQKHHE